MAGIQAGGGSAGRLSIEIVAEVARLQADMDKVKRLVKDASGDIAKNAAAANDNLGKLGTGFNKTSGNARGFSLQMSQVGQQVMAGTSLIQALAMQLPDVAAGMNAGTAGGSKFAAFLGGPWGIAVTTGIGLAATFAMKLLDTEDASKKAEKGQRSFVEVLRDSKSTWDEIRKAAQNYNDEQKKLQQTTLDGIILEAQAIKARSDNAVKDLMIMQKKLQAAKDAEELVAATGGGAEAMANSAKRILVIEASIKNIAAGIKKIQGSADAVSVKAATAIAAMNVDPTVKIRTGYDELKKRVQEHGGSTRELAAALTDLGFKEQAALERASQANRKHSDETIKLAKVTGAEIAKALGTTVTSGLRTPERNAAIKGAKNSYHLTGQAIDIPLTVGGRPLTKAGIRAALAPMGVQIKELLGPGDKGHNDHFHIAFGIKRLAPDQVSKLQDDAADAARKAAEKSRDELAKFRTDILASSYEMEELLTKALLPGFLAAEKKVWDEFTATVEKSANVGTDAAAEGQQAWAQWNDELRNTINLLDDIGSSGRNLGDIGAVLAGLTSGDWSGAKGPAGSLFKMLGDTQWRDPADANGLGEIRVLREEIVKGLDKVFGGKGSFGKTMTGALKNAGIGTAASSILFGKQSKSEKVGSAVGGAVGGAIGKEVLGKALGEFAGPLGAIAGGLLGSVVGGLFKKAKWGRVDLTSAGVSGASGNSGSSEKAALASGNSILTGLKDLATQLGGTLGDFGKISVGVRNDDYRVNTGGTSLKIKKGAVNFGDDAEAAVAYAMKEAIERGAINGIRASTNSLLKAGDDLQTQLQKAINFEGVFTELKGYTDPIGAALDGVNKQFDQLRVVFQEAGASAEEYAQLEQLLTIKRQEAMAKEQDALDDIKSRIAEAQGDDVTVKAIARAKELKEALNDNVRAELQHLYSVEDAADAQQKLADAQATAATAAGQLRDAWTSISGDLVDEVNRIRGLTGGDSGASFAALQGQFNAAAGGARGGDQEAAKKLVGLSQSLLEAAGNTATSRQELDRIKAATAATLEGVNDMLGKFTGADAAAPSAGTIAAASSNTPSPDTSAATDSLLSEMRAVRQALDQLRSENNSGHAATSGKVGKVVSKLDEVTEGGDAIRVANAA